MRRPQSVDQGTQGLVDHHSVVPSAVSEAGAVDAALAVVAGELGAFEEAGKPNYTCFRLGLFSSEIRNVGIIL